MQKYDKLCQNRISFVKFAGYFIEISFVFGKTPVLGTISVGQVFSPEEDLVDK